ncbi:uncharacterized protein LOC107490353 [Arachis duranensis]|uniref:Uncharacterized protein LOC107490353 n=1 Tax=Arachis duranensis TaxID=130453 RepID=A0A9C6WTM7_ARADU|nr:uncharacterized protein LOC107490353 [Arachis duranensis]
MAPFVLDNRSDSVLIGLMRCGNCVRWESGYFDSGWKLKKKKKKKIKSHGVKFTDKEPLSVFIGSSSTLSDLKNSILQKFGVFGTKWVKKLFYKIPITIVSTGVQYDTFVLAADKDIRVLFHCVRSFPEIRIHELFAKLEVGVDSSRASAPFHSSTAAGGASSSMPAVRPYLPPVGSSTFAADLERTVVVGSVQLENEGIFEQPDVVGTGGCQLPYMEGFSEPDRVENAMCDDDSDQEPVDIIGDSDDDTGANPHVQHGPSSSASQQYPPHFSTLNLEVLGQQEDGGNTVGGSSTEFQIGQPFQNKDEAMLSVKDYSIRRGVEYRVIESDHLKYHGKCKQFGKGCTWLIRVALRARKGTWEVRRYNGPHTCLETSISSDHRQLDYHVICARILSLVRADAAVTVKVLQQATEADYGSRPSYKKAWMAKQKEGILVISDRHNGIKAALEAPETGGCLHVLSEHIVFGMWQRILP